MISLELVDKRVKGESMLEYKVFGDFGKKTTPLTIRLRIESRSRGSRIRLNFTTPTENAQPLFSGQVVMGKGRNKKNIS